MRIKRTKQTFSFLIKVVAILSAVAIAGVGGYTAYKNFVEKPECTEHVDANGDNICDVCEAVLEGTDEHVHEFAPATCTTPATCECGATEGEALGHTVVTDAAVEPTCTETGLTAGEHCSVCDEVLVAQTVIEATGHSYADGSCGVCGAEDPDYVKPVEKVWTLITELKTGDIVLIGNAANGKLLSALKVSAGSFYNKGVDYSATDFGNVTDDEKWVVTVNEDGSYSFTALNGDKLALAESYSSLNATGVHDKWTLVDKGNGVYNLKNAGRGNYLEWYASKGNWSTYNSISGNLFEISFYALREPVSHEHSYESAVTAPTCTEAGYTTYTCSCGDSYVADEVAALGHSFTEGVCGVCGAEDPDYVKPDVPSVPAGGEADFDSIVTTNANGDSSYTKTFITANGWVVQYAAIQSGGATNMNPQFTVIGPDNTHKAVCLVGKTSAPGKITSPTLTTGISKLTINYTKMFTDTQLSVTVTVTELATGTKYTRDITVTLDKNDKYTVYTDVWTLDTPVVGDFTIEIVNNCPTGQNGNKDRITILDIIWEGAAEVHTHEYTSTTTATCTAAGTTTYTCSCGDTYTEETEKLGHVDANLDVSCDREGCTGKVAPAADSVLSNFTANNLGSKISVDRSYYVTGTIVEVLDAKNGIFLIDDGTGEKFYFRLPKNAEGVSHANWEIKLVLGDKVQVYGKINKFSSPDAPNGQYWPAIQGGIVTVLEQHPHDFTSVPATCFYPAYCACGYDNGVSLGHTDGNSDNICDSCGYSTSSLLEEVKTHFQSIKDTDKVDNTNGTATFDGTEFVITVTKGTSSLNSNGSNHMRMNKGNDITIAAKNGNKIVSITFVPVSSSYLDELEAFLQTTEYKDTYTVDGIECTIQLNNVDSIKLVNGNKVQRIASVKIVYESASTTEA